MTLHLNLFGGFEARLHDGLPVVFARKKAQALLAYLALHADQAHPRNKLAALLWSDVAEPSGRASMRQALVSIRRAFGNSQARLIADTDAVRLDAHDAQIDVKEFERLAAGGTAASLAAAARLYRGPLLEGLRAQSAVFEEWLHGERERLHELALDVMGRLLAAQTGAGDFDSAVQTAIRLLALDPLQEAVHRALMRLYARQGRRAAALRQYQACVDALHRELDAEPEAETKRAYTDILSAGEAGRLARGPPGPLHARPVGTLIGRSTELARLTGALHHVEHGAGRTGIILGEAGIGKSRLTGEIVDLASARDLQVLVGQAYESEQILPFGVWVQALRSSGILSAALLDGVEPVWRAELARLFPEAAPQSSPPPSVEDHLRLFEAMARLLMHLAKRCPLVVVLEDLHWADGMSVRLLPFVSRRTAGAPVLLLATVREEQVGDAPGLRSAIDEIADDPSAAIMTLAPLSRIETTALIEAHASRASRQQAVAERVWALSEGNPFVALEALRASAAGEGAPPLQGAQLPERVRHMIRRRLDRLGPLPRRLADAAAVIGRDFDFRLLHEAAGITDHAAAGGLEELVRERVVRMAGDSFAFAHDRLRHTFYGDLLPPVRAALHLAAARAIERLHAGRLEEAYDRLGHHYTRTDDAERAVMYLARFAEQASRQYALDDGVAALRDARVHVAKLPAGARDRRLLELLGAEASYLFYLGRLPELIDLLARHTNVFNRVADPSPAGPCHAWLAAAFALSGRHAEAAVHAERAIAVAGRAGDHLTQGQGYAVLALGAFWSGTPKRGVEHARQAAALLAEGRNIEWLFYAHLYAAVNSIQLGDLDAARAANRVAASVAECADSARLRTFAAWSTGWAEASRGESAAAVDACRRAVSLAPDPLGLANALGFLGYAYLEGGDPSAARAALTDAAVRSAECGLRPQEGWFNAWLAEAHLALGEIDPARELAAAAIEIERQVAFPYGIGVALRAAGRVALAGGDLVAAGAALEQAVETFRSIPAPLEVVRAESEVSRLVQPRDEAASA